MAAVPTIKTCMLGGGGQGKSALVMKFITGAFLSDYDPTIEDTYSKNVTVNGESALVEILDTAGQEVFWSMQDQWIRDSQIFLFTYSICSRDGFKTIDLLRNKVLRVKETESIPTILVGTHSDLSSERVITKDQAQQKATKWDCEYIEVSSFTSTNLTQLFDMVLPLYFQHFGGGRHNHNINADVIPQIQQQQQSQESICCPSLCGDGGDDFDDIEDDDIYSKISKGSNKIQFFKTEELPPDHIPSPILSLKNFRLVRTFYWGRFFKAGLSGIFVPIVVIFQTFVFLSYSEKHESSVLYPDTFSYDDKASLLWDYLGMFVGRKPGQDPEGIKDRRYFLRQTAEQKTKRIMITVIICLIFMVSCYNISQVNKQQVKVSYIETIGPFMLFWIVWLLLSVWIAYDQQLRPAIPAPARLRSLTIFFGEDFSHRSSVYKFVRAFESSRTNNRWKLSKLRTFIVLFLGLLYALTPGLTRLTFGDSSEGSSGSGTFFSKDGDYLLEIGALIVNFVLIASIIYCVEIQYKKQFDNYRGWMSDLTQILHKKEKMRDAFRLSMDESMVEIPSKGSAISRDLFLSMIRRQNALGWLEIRSFLAVQGQVLFGEQELPTTWFISITCLLTLFTFYRTFFITGSPVESILFNGLAILTVICLIALIRILITGYQFEGLQVAQEKLLAEQKFYMRCNRPYDDLMLDSHAIGSMERGQSKSKSKLLQNPLHRDSIRESPFNAGDDNKEEQELKQNTEINTAENELDNDDGEDNEAGNGNIEMIEVGAPKTVKIKFDSYGTVSDPEEENDDREPLLNKADALTVVKDKVMRMDDVNRYSYNVAFIEDLLVLVKKKDIFPRLFKLKLNSILSKIVTLLALVVLVTAFKLYVG